MKSKILLTTFLVLFLVSACHKDDEKATIACTAGPNALTFRYGGVDRQYLFYKPANLPPNAPLVFVLHGYSQNAEQYYYMGFNPIADTAKFALCYPQGINCGWNVDSHNSSDVDFLKALAHYMQSIHSLNPGKTFVTGFSAGGAMSNLLALDAGDVFKAAAPVAGFVFQSNWNSKNPQDIVPFFAIHGTDDKFISINGYSAGDPSTQEIVNYWATKNNCTASDTVQYTANTTVYHYTNGTNGKEVWFYKVNGMDHVFPGDPNTKAGADISGFNACVEIWKFFRKY
jgi:polyhydroxybutyrate depolymerase